MLLSDVMDRVKPESVHVGFGFESLFSVVKPDTKNPNLSVFYPIFSD